MTKETRECYKGNFNRERNPYEKQISRPWGPGYSFQCMKKQA